MRKSAETAAANTMATAFMGSMVTFLVTVSYLGVAAGSTTHAQLLTGRDIKLPLLGVDVSVGWFFPIACWMTLILHVVFMLQVNFLFRKLRTIGDASEQRRALVPALLVEAFFPVGERPAIWWILRVVLMLPLFPIPWFLHVGILLRFSVSRPGPLELAICLAAALLDLAICWLIIPEILKRPSSSLGGDRWRLVRRWELRVFEAVSLFFPLLLLLPVLVLEPIDCQSDRRWVRALSGLGPCLDAADAALVDDDRAREWLAADAARRRATLRLAGRDLRGADLRRARLVGTDLRGADLERSVLRDARLTGADLGPLPPRSATPAAGGARLAVTDLRDAVLTEADLRGARLYRADLRRADLTGADLTGADLTGADLRGADLTAARLDVALLRFADLRGAVLDGASMACADLGSVRAGGLRAQGAEAVGVDLRYALLTGSHWADARLEGAFFRGARLVGSDFRGAHLSWSRELPLRKLGLRQARLVGASPASALDEIAPVLTDLRGVVWSAPGGEPPPRAKALIRGRDSDLESLRRSLRPFPAAQDRLAACRKRLDDELGERREEGGPTPMQDALRSPLARANLGLDAAPMAEKPFHDLLLEELVPPASPLLLDPEACSSPELARSLILRSQGCLEPQDPVFEQRLSGRIFEVLESCDAVGRLVAGLPEPLRPRPVSEEDRMPWPPAQRFPRWQVSQTSCDDLHRALWHRSAAGGDG